MFAQSQATPGAQLDLGQAQFELLQIDTLVRALRGEPQPLQHQ